jgi:hypothetical protein
MIRRAAGQAIFDGLTKKMSELVVIGNVLMQPLPYY